VQAAFSAAHPLSLHFTIPPVLRFTLETAHLKPNRLAGYLPKPNYQCPLGRHPSTAPCVDCKVREHQGRLPGRSVPNPQG
jgi:hypothetical protein